MTAREAAFVSLQKYENNKKYANIEADAAIRRNGLEGADRALYTTIFYGTVERRITLDYYIGQLSERKTDAIDGNVRIILRMSLYQLAYLDRVPDYAILNDAGELCKRFAANSAVAFVNGILRSYLRQRELPDGGCLRLPDPKADPVRYLSVRYSYPAWLCEMWRADYGHGRTERIFRAFENNPPLTLRVNTLKTTADALYERLRSYGIGVRRTTLAPNGLRLTGHCPPEEVPGFGEGHFFIQDEASQLAAYTLDPQPGHTVIDACACPGGKSFSTAMWMEDKGRVLSFDLHKNKLSLVKSGAEALGITCITVGEQNGSKYVEALAGSADRVLCDVPCSGLGVLSKKPDIRYKEPSEIERLPDIQYGILDNCAGYVKPGGILVYATCTLNKRENEDNVRRFLSEHPEYEPVSFPVGAGRMAEGMMTVFPDEFEGADGFFIAKMRRRA